MDNLFEIIDDPDAQKKKMDTENFLCLILRKDLGPLRTFLLATHYYMYAIEYKSEQYFAIAFGMYQDDKLQKDEQVQAFINDVWGQRDYKDETESQIFEKFLEEPCCLLLRDGLNRNQKMLLDQTYEILAINYEGRKRRAIACIIYNRNTEKTIESEPKIVSQFQITK